jgi:hypothetical protein
MMENTSVIEIILCVLTYALESLESKWHHVNFMYIKIISFSPLFVMNGCMKEEKINGFVLKAIILYYVKIIQNV